MGVRQIAGAALLAVVALAAPEAAGTTISLGELQAVRSHTASYVFHVPLAFQPQDQGETAAVTVRSPADAMAVVRNHVLELRLPRLTDVEIEVSHAGQTFNRLWLTAELQRARAPLEAITAWKRYQAAKAKEQSMTRLATLLDTALALHHTWARLDPAGARQSLALVSQEQATLRSASRPQAAASLVQETATHTTDPPAPAPATSAVDAMGLEEEWRALRAEMQTLVGGVLLWEHEGPDVPLMRSRTSLAALAMLGGGLFMVGMALLVRAYRRQRWALDRERQHRRLLAAAIHRGRQALPPNSRALPQETTALSPGLRRPGLKSVAVVRHVHVSHRIRRQLQRRQPIDRQGTLQAPSLEEQTRFVTPMAPTGQATAAELLTALGDLRHELISLWLMFPAAHRPEDIDAGSPHGPHR